MSVIATVRISGDPATFEQQVAAHADAIGRIMDVARRHGLIARRAVRVPANQRAHLLSTSGERAYEIGTHLARRAGYEVDRSRTALPGSSSTCSALAARSRIAASPVCQRVSSLIAAMRQRSSRRRRPNR
jgi:hypothetical protein